MKPKLFNRVALAAASFALTALVGLALPHDVAAQSQAQGAITPNYKDADLGQIIEAVSAVTGKNFIVDPRVKAQVTMLSSTPMSPDAFYEAFLSILQVHGFVAVPSGDVIKIIPDANARQLPSIDLPSRVSSTSDEIVTQVIAVKNVSAAQLVPILRPLIPQYGHLAAYPSSNMLIISDRASNVSRMVRIIQRIDQTGDEAIDVIPMQHASAAEVVRIVNSLNASAGAEGGGMPQAKVVADERTNSVLVSGETSQRLRLKALDHAPRHAARSGRRHAGALPAIRGRREDFARSCASRSRASPRPRWPRAAAPLLPRQRPAAVAATRASPSGPNRRPMRSS